MIEILTWVSIISGGILILLLLLSIIGGLDFDLDVDLGSTDTETDASGLGLFKGLLTFISVTSWVIKVFLATNKHIGLAIGVGIFAGIASIMVLSYIIKLLMSNESEVNWKIEDSLFQKGKVYLKIPAEDGEGIVQVEVNGAIRELKAKSYNDTEIPTGSPITVLDIKGEYAMVQNETN